MYQFTLEQSSKIARAIEGIEAITSCEIRVAVVRQASDYWGRQVRQHPKLWRRLLGKKYMLRMCWIAAGKIFANQQMKKTQRQNGVLIAVFEFERQVIVYADQTVAIQFQQEEWDRAVEIILEGCRAGNEDSLTRALELAIRSIGNKLSERFPRVADDQNELSDELLVIDRP